MLALREAPAMAPSDEETRRLARDGFLVLHDVLDAGTAGTLARLVDELVEAEGESAGGEFRHLVPEEERQGVDHLGNLIGKDPRFGACLAEPRVLGVVRHVLGPDVRLHAINARSPRRGEGLQVLHTHRGLCNTLWLLDDMTTGNGPTRVIPGSHRQPSDTDDVADWRAPHPHEHVVTARAGAVIVLTGDVLHGGTTNRSGAPRRIVTTAYSAPQLAPQYELG